MTLYLSLSLLLFLLAPPLPPSILRFAAQSSPQETGVVYVTLPMPRSSMTAAEYFSVIELLTVEWENCPTVFIRGNARDCLTGFWDPQFSADAEGGRRDEAENFDISAARDPSASEARAESGLAQQRDD